MKNSKCSRILLDLKYVASVMLKVIFFIHPNYSSTRGEFKVLISLISDKYDSDTTNGMVMNCLSESEFFI